MYVQQTSNTFVQNHLTSEIPDNSLEYNNVCLAINIYRIGMYTIIHSPVRFLA